MFSHPKLDKPATRRDIEELKDCIAGLTEIVCQLTVVRKRDERTHKASRKRQRQVPQRQSLQLASSPSSEEPATIEEPALESQEDVTLWPEHDLLGINERKRDVKQLAKQLGEDKKENLRRPTPECPLSKADLLYIAKLSQK
jgi:hypothetical protein